MKPSDLLLLCRTASGFYPMSPAAQRALHDALTALDIYHGGWTAFVDANEGTLRECAAMLEAFIASRVTPAPAESPPPPPREPESPK